MRKNKTISMQYLNIIDPCCL